MNDHINRLGGHARAVCDRRLEALHEGTRTRSVLTEEHMLRDAGTRVWLADHFDGTPSFYPVYKSGNAYAFSPLDLVLREGRFSPILSPKDGPDFDMLPNDLPFAAGIERIGGPPTFTRVIDDPGAYAEAMAEAMQADVTDAERNSDAERNVVLCGGKDSLNLLLLDYDKPVIAYSAAPNTELVRQFVRDNGLSIEVRVLEDRITDAGLAEEAMENLGRMNLAHWRWTGHLREIAAQAPTLFWKGQLGDVVMTDFWKIYRVTPDQDRAILRRAYRKLAPRLPASADTGLGRLAGRKLPNVLWARGAGAQGNHMGFLRSLTGAVFRSVYHGSAASAVWSQADLQKVARDDIRHLVGERLLGQAVRYPTANPGPPVSAARQELHSVRVLYALLTASGIPVQHERTMTEVVRRGLRTPMTVRTATRSTATRSA